MTKVLIVEDDKILSKMYALKFKNSGFDTEVAHNGKEGLDLMKIHHPELVLMDLMMPIMDGFAALTEAKKDPLIKNIPVIVLTNLSMAEDVSRAIKLGAIECIVKSNLTPTQIVDKVKEIIKSIKKST